MPTILNRRSFFKQTSALFAASQAGFLARVGMGADADNVIAETSAGKVRGVAVEEIKVFKGIPYAAPPVGALRWGLPQPVAAWPGERAADDFGSSCRQREIPRNVPTDSRAAQLSEDCLTLNVWTPAEDKDAKLPVMVWIYGGGFFAGGTS